MTEMEHVSAEAQAEAKSFADTEGPLEGTLVTALVMDCGGAQGLKAHIFHEGAEGFTARLHEQRKSKALNVHAWSGDAHMTRRVTFDSPPPSSLPGVTAVPIEEFQMMRNGDTEDEVRVVTAVYAGAVPGSDRFYTFLKYEFTSAAAGSSSCRLRLSYVIRYHKPVNAIMKRLINYGTGQGMQTNANMLADLLKADYEVRVGGDVRVAVDAQDAAGTKRTGDAPDETATGGEADASKRRKKQRKRRTGGDTDEDEDVEDDSGDSDDSDDDDEAGATGKADRKRRRRRRRTRRRMRRALTSGGKSAPDTFSDDPAWLSAFAAIATVQVTAVALVYAGRWLNAVRAEADAHIVSYDGEDMCVEKQEETYMAQLIAALDLPTSTQQVLWTCILYTLLSTLVTLGSRRLAGAFDTLGSAQSVAVNCLAGIQSVAGELMSVAGAVYEVASSSLMSLLASGGDGGSPDASVAAPGGDDEKNAGANAGAGVEDEQTSASIPPSTQPDLTDASHAEDAETLARRRRRLAKGLSKRFTPVVWTSYNTSTANSASSSPPTQISGADVMERDEVSDLDLDAIVQMGYLSRTTTLNTSRVQHMDPTHIELMEMSEPTTPVDVAPVEAFGTVLSAPARGAGEPSLVAGVDDDDNEHAIHTTVDDEGVYGGLVSSSATASAPSRSRGQRRHSRRLSRSSSPPRRRRSTRVRGGAAGGGISADSDTEQHTVARGMESTEEKGVDVETHQHDSDTRGELVTHFDVSTPSMTSASRRRRRRSRRGSALSIAPSPVPAFVFPQEEPGLRADDDVSIAGGNFEVEIFEHERKQMIYGFGSSRPGHLFPTDRCRWTDRHGNMQNQNFVEIIEELRRRCFGDVYAHANLSGLPMKGEPWIWFYDWKVDVSGVGDERVDEKGWSYAVNFGLGMFGHPPAPGKGRRHWNSFVRRRRWTQTADIVYIRVALLVSSAPGNTAAAGDVGDGYNQDHHYDDDDDDDDSCRSMIIKASPRTVVHVQFEVGDDDDAYVHVRITDGSDSAAAAAARALTLSLDGTKHARADILSIGVFVCLVYVQYNNSLLCMQWLSLFVYSCSMGANTGEILNRAVCLVCVHAHARPCHVFDCCCSARHVVSPEG